MKDRNYRVHGDLVNSDRIMHQTFWIGVYPGLGAEQINYVLETIHEFCKSPVLS
jgi:CDP-6-deoxy-D-xylo-4-hexulose-3-dehydrase